MTPSDQEEGCGRAPAKGARNRGHRHRTTVASDPRQHETVAAKRYPEPAVWRLRTHPARRLGYEEWAGLASVYLLTSLARALLPPPGARQLRLRGWRRARSRSSAAAESGRLSSRACSAR